MTSIAEAWSGIPYSTPIVNAMKPNASDAAVNTVMAHAQDGREFVKSYIKRQHALFGPRGVVPLLPPHILVGLRNYSLFHFEYWTDLDVAVLLCAVAVAVMLLD